MKTKLFTFIVFVALLYCGSSCSDNNTEEKYPVSLGKQTFVGKIIQKGNPCTTTPCLPCAVFWLETSDKDYVLSINSFWFCDKPLIVDGTEYFIDDEVEITGIGECIRI